MRMRNNNQSFHLYAICVLKAKTSVKFMFLLLHVPIVPIKRPEHTMTSTINLHCKIWHFTIQKT